MRFNIVKWALLALLTLMLGCGRVQGNDYNVLVDPAFSSDEVQAVIDASDDWKGHIDGLRMWPVIASCKGVEDGTICIHLSNHAEVLKHNGTEEAYAVTDPGDKGAEVWIDAHDIALYPTYLKMIVEHEMGHAMGLVHDPHQDTLMHPHPEVASSTVTCADMTQWYLVRGLVVPACGF